MFSTNDRLLFPNVQAGAARAESCQSPEQTHIANGCCHGNEIPRCNAATAPPVAYQIWIGQLGPELWQFSCTCTICRHELDLSPWNWSAWCMCLGLWYLRTNLGFLGILVFALGGGTGLITDMDRYVIGPFSTKDCPIIIYTRSRAKTSSFPVECRISQDSFLRLHRFTSYAEDVAIWSYLLRWRCHMV